MVVKSKMTDFEASVNVRDLNLFKSLLRAVSNVIDDDRVPIDLKLALRTSVNEILDRVNIK